MSRCKQERDKQKLMVKQQTEQITSLKQKLKEMGDEQLQQAESAEQN